MISDKGPRVFLPPPLIFLGLVVLGLLVDSDPIAVGLSQIIGGVLMVGGSGLIAVAVGLFRKSGTRAEPWKPASVLVNFGPYRFTRNPMYLGMAMISLGTALLFSSFAGIALAIIATVIIDRAVIRREEAYLVRRFGQDYVDYTSRVRRWF